MVLQAMRHEKPKNIQLGNPSCNHTPCGTTAHAHHLKTPLPEVCELGQLQVLGNEIALHVVSCKVHSQQMGKLLYCVRSMHAVCTQMPGSSPKITYHLSDSTAKQQNPHNNNETAFKLVLQCPHEQNTEPCKVQLCRGMQDAHIFKWQVPHSDISPRRWPHNWQQTPSSFSSSEMVASSSAHMDSGT